MSKIFGQHAADEYDFYLGGILELFTSSASDQQIAIHLWKIVTERMGLESAKLEDIMPTVHALRLIPLPR